MMSALDVDLPFRLRIGRGALGRGVWAGVWDAGMGLNRAVEARLERSLIMALIDSVMQEFEHEPGVTRKVLARGPRPPVLN